MNVNDFSEFDKMEVNLSIFSSDDDPSNLPSLPSSRTATPGTKTSTPGTSTVPTPSRDSLLPPVCFKIVPSAYGISQAAFDELNFEGKRLGKIVYDAAAYHRLKAKGKITEMQMLEIMNAFQGQMYELLHPEKLSFWNPSSASMESFNLSDYNSGSATASEELPPHLDSFLASNHSGAKFRGLGGGTMSGTPVMTPVMNDAQPKQDKMGELLPLASVHSETGELQPLTSNQSA